MKLIKETSNRKLTGWDAFSLVEILLAIGILGGAILCLLGVLTPVMSKMRENTRVQNMNDIEGKINGFVQSRSFDEIFTYVKEGQCFYFYKDAHGEQKVTKVLNEVDGSLINKIILLADGEPDIALYQAKDYPKSYLPIRVGVYSFQGKDDRKDTKAIASSFKAIKNR